MTEWLISGNPKKYDCINAFRDLKKINWKQVVNVQQGDMVYLYVSRGYNQIKFKCRVNKVDLKNLEIDDGKYNVSGEFDGTYGRYMELEMLEEFDTELFSSEILERYGFSAPQNPARVLPKLKEYLDIVQKLLSAEELDPNKHDGSYELVKETINAYSRMGDLSFVDYKDLNLVYLMCIGTWKHKIPAKKNTVNESHLPESEKKRLVQLIDKIWQNAEREAYSNQESGKASIGMFGTGFFTFQGKTDNLSPRNFIQMCIDIKDKSDEDEIFYRCSKALTHTFRGMKAASASMVLHCLRPFVFPIFNSNMGSDNIFEYFGVQMKSKEDIQQYINNVRLVKKYRDKNFKIKNYRIFDMVAWNIVKLQKNTDIDYLGVLEYLENNREVPYSSPQASGLDEKERERLLKVKAKGQNSIKEMKKMAELCKKTFKFDKCEPMVWLDGSNTKTRKYLWAQLKYSNYGSRPESISLFVDMSEETKRARYRFSLELKNDGSDKDILSNYHKHLDIPLKQDSNLVYVSGSNEFGNPAIINEDQDTIKFKIASGIYKKVQICRIVNWKDTLTNDEIEKAMLEGIGELIPYYEYVIGLKKPDTYWPSLDEYNPGITKENWIDILNNPKITKPEYLDLLKKILNLGGESTCANLEKHYGGNHSTYNAYGRSFGMNVYKETECELFKDEDRERYYTIPFVGRRVIEEGNERYSWKLRSELKEALEEMELSNVNVKNPKGDNVEYYKNTILYGPPGTGKTYNTAIYAVAICEGLPLDEIVKLPYKDVLDKYRNLKDIEKRIAFTTFHQSYGYEEFIEGIKPKLDNRQSSEIEYEIKDGIFKSFCYRAREKKVQAGKAKVREGARVWNVILGGSGAHKLKRKCFDEGTIRIGWSGQADIITEDNNNLNDKEKRILLNFQDEMEIGDIVVVRASKSTIDGIGIVAGSYAYDKSDSEYPRMRKVDWIVKDYEIDVFQLNGGVRLDRKSIYELTRINATDLLDLIPESFKTGVEIKMETKPFVFIIDEINRGNISKIFGELITLIEPTKRRGENEAMEALLPYSNQPFGVPNNVYIIGTMNTADRSIALMDTALRRRFQFVEMMPDANILRNIGADKVEDAGRELDVVAMLETINKRIEYLYDREHTIGHAFFTALKDDKSVSKLASIFKKSVIPLLQEYFYEDYRKIMLVLGDNGKTNNDYKFILDREIKPNAIFRGDTSDIDIPEYSYEIQDKAFDNIMSYIEIIG